jgi:peptide/nickel transport system substrate-binding protein
MTVPSTRFSTPKNVGGTPLYLPRRTILKGTIAAAAVGFWASACGPVGSSSSAGGGSSKTTLVEAAAAMPVTLAMDTGRGVGYEGFEVWQLVQANLVRNPYVPDPNDPNVIVQDWYHWEGELAEGYDVSKDGLTYTFHLAKGVVSQAGNPLTADDVLWSFKRKFNTPNISSYLFKPSITNPAKQITKVDDHTVQIKLAAAGHGFPMLAVISKLAGHIYDSKLLLEHTTKKDPYALEYSNVQSKGNFGFGPYKITSYEEGNQIVFESNSGYVKGEPALKKITMRIVPDAGNRAALLKAGDVDTAVQLLPADIADMSKDKNLRTFSVETNNFTWLLMNAKSKVFADQKVRQAFFKAIPYDQIIKTVYHGAGKPAKGWMDPKAPGYDGAGIPDQVYDPKGALKLLGEAGVSTPVKFSIMCSSAVPDLQEVAVQMQSFGKDAGFEIKVDVVPATTDADRKNARDYEACLMRDMVVSWESQTYTLRLLRGTGPNDPGNWLGWAPPEYLAEIDAGVAAGDPFGKAAGKHWHKAHLMLMEGCTLIQVCNVTPLMAQRSNVTPYTQRSDNVYELSRLKKT